MSARGGWFQDAMAQLVGALSFNKSTSRTADPNTRPVEAIPLADSQYSERDLRDRERELRILMANWM